MSARGGGRRGGAHEEEHENHERWLVSYADMMTLLMVLFIVMFAISQVDQHKFAALKEGLSSGFGATTNIPISGGSGIQQQDGVVPEPMNMDVGLGTVSSGHSGEDQKAYKDSSDGKDASKGPTAQSQEQVTQANAIKEVQRLDGIEKKIREALKAKGLQNDVRFKVTERGLVVAMVSDDVFFESASATLRPRGITVLQAVSPAIRNVPNDIAVEGHANRLKLTSSVYPTNWELSGARAAGVVRWLISNGQFRATQLSATGYGSSRPMFPASDPRSIAFNRRVDIVLVSNQSPEVRALLPKLAPQLSDM
ncbi:flagellar motor protein MotB [Angustibacter luteus]|uniref:Flagellar motor protein MotB n=1 Tax=Angustibacter luteus TaxID=658456 RepID=A0ABW1JHA6_9ACTN